MGPMNRAKLPAYRPRITTGFACVVMLPLIAACDFAPPVIEIDPRCFANDEDGYYTDGQTVVQEIFPDDPKSPPPPPLECPRRIVPPTPGDTTTGGPDVDPPPDPPPPGGRIIFVRPGYVENSVPELGNPAVPGGNTYTGINDPAAELATGNQYFSRPGI